MMLQYGSIFSIIKQPSFLFSFSYVVDCLIRIMLFILSVTLTVELMQQKCTLLKENLEICTETNLLQLTRM